MKNMGCLNFVRKVRRGGSETARHKSDDHNEIKAVDAVVSNICSDGSVEIVYRVVMGREDEVGLMLLIQMARLVSV